MFMFDCKLAKLSDSNKKANQTDDSCNAISEAPFHRPVGIL